MPPTLFHVGVMKIVLVAAIGDNLVIGRDGQLPWHLKSDLQHFRKVTLNRR
jgi:dihydrofolate reductase